MDSLLIDVIHQAPGLAVAAFIVVKFLNYIKVRNGALEKTLEAHRRTMEETNKIIQENSRVQGEVLQAISFCKEKSHV